jgi:glucoamylase
MSKSFRPAPGGPGGPALWTSGAKTGVGTAIGSSSSVWFTVGDGILNEVFYPFVDIACIRQLELIVSDGREFLSEEKRDTRSEARYVAEGVPAFHLTNTCKEGRYRIEKTILADPDRSTILQQIEFVPLQSSFANYLVYALLTPHIGNQGGGNTAWVGDYKGVPMLFAQREGTALALACSEAWRKCSVGFIVSSDGRQDLKQHGKMTWEYDRAENGDVALMGEVALTAAKGRFAIALGFGRNETEAGYRARASLFEGFETVKTSFLRGWTNWQRGISPLKFGKKHERDLYHISAAVIRTHESKAFPGAIIASLAIPWGASHGDDDLGYHLVWPRDMIETVGGLLAIEAHEDARRILRYFAVTQDADGHWPQNMFLDGKPNWNGIQLDETALVIVLVEWARREEALEKEHLAQLWPMVRRAAGYLVRHGPLTPMDRWEEEPGYFASTIAVEIAALLAAADLAALVEDRTAARYLRETADAWNAAIDDLIYVTDTDLARRAGVDGYYVRFAKPGQREALSPAAGEVTVKNRPPGQGQVHLAELVSVDALMLVRMGLRAADDPRILNTVKVIDLQLKVETPFGDCWHRYNEDGYGEHADGAPFDGTGIGRAWPLLTGERAHYELAAGNAAGAAKLLLAMESFANECGLLPEQIWDAPDVPERKLYCGRPSGSAMPLVWAHAEYIKLRRSLQDGRVFDTPPQTVQRYVVAKTGSPHCFWRTDQPCRTLPAGKILRLELLAPAMVRWSTDEWRTPHEDATRDTGLGIHVLDLPTNGLGSRTEVVFAIHWTEDGHWEGKNHRVSVRDIPSLA